MTISKRVNLFLGFCIIVALILLAAPSWATDTRGDIIQSNDNNAQTTGDLNIAGDDSLGIGLALSYGMGDVDINEGQNCMGSEQKANIIWGSQELALNPWCASLFYELNGKHTFAAKVRCDIADISKHYTSAEECVLDQDLTPAEPLGEGSSGVADAIVSHIDDAVDKHDKDLEQVQMAQSSIVGRLDYLTQQLEELPAQQEEPAAQQKQWDPQPTYTDEQAEAIWALLDREEMDDE